MWFPNLATLLLTSLLLASASSAARTTSSTKAPKNAVLLSKISTLTFRAGKQTTARRTAPIPQAQCVGPKEVCKLYTVDAIRCTNAGSDYDEENVQWTCTAQLPEEFKLGSTDVGCEGYASSEDPYVLKGSCGVEYRLLLTEKGEEKYGMQSGSSMGEGGETASDLVKALFLIIFVGVLAIILFAACSRAGGTGRAGAGRGFGGFGGGGGGDDPPPPYDYQPPPSQKRTTSSSTRGTSGARQEQWRPGFWTGALGGAAAGYMAGNRGQTRQPETQQRGSGLFGGGGANAGGNSWFGAGNNNAGEGSSRSSYSPAAASSSRYESTGFGSTSRR